MDFACPPQYIHRQARYAMKRRAIWVLVASLFLLGACAGPLPVQLEGQGGSATKTRLKVKLPY
jgi:hypothetical protein